MWVQAELYWELTGAGLHSAWSRQEASATLSYSSLHVTCGAQIEPGLPWQNAVTEEQRDSIGTNSSFPLSCRH